MNEYKILILYASYGDGHFQVARALQQAFFQKGVEQIKMIDLYTDSYPRFNELIRQLYIKGSAYFPYFYGWTYKYTQNMKQDQWLAKCFQSWGAEQMKRIIEQEKPDVLIHTFPMPSVRAQTNSRPPIFTVLTDFAIHNRWIHSEYDVLFVPTNELKTTIIQRGIDARRIEVSGGIPVRASFQSPSLRSSVDADTGLSPFQDERQVVLIIAGAYGVLSNLSTLIGRIRRSLIQARIVVVCGRNQKLYRTIHAKHGRSVNVEVYGFVEKMADLMASATCIVTKAGAITLSEAIASSLPIIVYRPLPGQEAENALYLYRKGAAAIAHTPSELVEQIKRLLSPDAPEKEGVEELSKSSRYASDSIVNRILDEITCPASFIIKDN
ncbi:glycosyltransferase [Paenibacillus sp. J2TS4]|uniref:MGDG synthase family glycosyltransferase n=1 Tax=Paenibacillus sp. J2TS4 TaxID=2807194 RepID=UPI001B2B4F59|nr:glycosyltransferase [Paenibacillus sp. J2TS4]GIP35246.1 processive diacylglycerol beta-glucosyltransferase [Paenibacillus sp. J2TS4]